MGFFDFFKTNIKVKEMKLIICPHCSFEQEINPSISAFFCKKCMKTIYTKNVLNKINEQNTSDQSFNNILSSGGMGMLSIECPYCNEQDNVPSIALASFCGKCGQRINLIDFELKKSFEGVLETRGEILIQKDAEIKGSLIVGSAIIEGKVTGNVKAIKKVQLSKDAIVDGEIDSPETITLTSNEMVNKDYKNDYKKLSCKYCNENIEAPFIATSKHCEKCNNINNLQDYKIKGNFQGQIDTLGEIRVAEDSVVVGSINVGSAVIEGKVEGNVIAKVKVIISKTGIVDGKIEAPKIERL